VFSRNAKLRLVDSRVTDSEAGRPGGQQGLADAGGGIYSDGARPAGLTLVDTIVRGNSAVFGGGVAARRVRLAGTTRVVGNVATYSGGGVRATRLVMSDDSQVDRNTAWSGGGGVFVIAPVHRVALRMAGSAAVDHNVVLSGRGGGVECEKGAVVLDDRAHVAHNAALGRSEGGGISASGKFAPVIMRGQSAVRGNTARDGGGIYQYGATLVLTDRATVAGNVVVRRGGGIATVKGHVRIRDHSAVVDNHAGRTGGGVFAESGRIRPASVRVAPTAVVAGNTPNDVVVR
jgi:hypothetical protein